MPQLLSELRHPSHPGSLRLKFYAWRRDARPARLTFALLALVVWPVAMTVRAFARLFATKRRDTRILVLHFAGLGDTLLLTPALAALQQNYPNASIDLITRHEYVREAFASHPRLNSITLLPPYSDPWLSPKVQNCSTAKLVWLTLWYYPELILKNCFRRYDLGVNFALSDFDRARGNALLFCIGVDSRVGSTGEHDELLTQSTEVDYSQTHRVQAYLDHLQPLKIRANGANYEFAITALDSLKVEQAIQRAGVAPTKPLVAIHPGGKLHINSRRWPAEYFVRVGEFLKANGFFVALTGDQEDDELCRGIAQTIGTGAASFAGSLSISETAALLSRSDLCITNDTATLHLAEAMLVPRVVSIFGPTDPTLLVPSNDRHLVFRSRLPCSPCMGSIIDGKTERCPREIKEECLWEVTPEEVIGALREQYERRVLRAVNS